ncbi:MAG: hypothetical protein IPO74_05055 [Thermomonas sp.]|nr:hypothetical protein [Thermomonas sp.]
MIRFQMQMRKTASLAVVVAALSACGNTSTTAPADTASGMQAAVEQAEGDAQAAGAASTGDAPLKPGQTIQGSIEADVGNGTQSFRSLATKVADDIGAQVEGNSIPARASAQSTTPTASSRSSAWSPASVPMTCATWSRAWPARPSTTQA